MAADAPGGRGAAGAERRDDLDDAPPFLTWRGIYFVVLGALVAQVAICVVLTVVFS